MSKTNSALRIAAACGLLALASCANMDDQQEKMLSGGAIGAVVGTVGTAITGGCIPCGTAIGAAVGVAGGYIVDQIDKNSKSGSGSSGSSSSSSSNSSSSNSGSSNSYQSSSYQSSSVPSNSSASTPYTNN